MKKEAYGFKLSVEIVCSQNVQGAFSEWRHCCFRSPSCRLDYTALTPKATFMPTYTQKASSDPVKLSLESPSLCPSLLPLWHSVLRSIWSLLNFGGGQHLHLVMGGHRRNNPLSLFFWKWEGGGGQICVVTISPSSSRIATYLHASNIWAMPKLRRLYIFTSWKWQSFSPNSKLDQQLPIKYMCFTLIWFFSPLVLFLLHVGTSSALTDASLPPLN